MALERYRHAPILIAVSEEIPLPPPDPPLETPGLYFLLEGQDVVYVGLSQHPRRAAHGWRRTLSFDQIRVVRCDYDEDAKRLLEKLIRYYRPPRQGRIAIPDITDEEELRVERWLKFLESSCKSPTGSVKGQHPRRAAHDGEVPSRGPRRVRGGRERGSRNAEA